MPHLTPQNTIIDADGDTPIILARGCSLFQLHGLSGRTVHDDTTAPSEDEAKSQVGEEPQFGKLIEFTADKAVARGFGTGGFIIRVKIKRKYLTQGSISESGWIARSDAPFEIVKVKKGRAFH